MELYKIEDVDFSINQDSVSDGNINLILREGELFLSLRNVVLTDGTKWYDLPIKELENVEVIGEEPTKLRFQLPSLEIVVTGKYAERLLALRHFILPFIHPQRKEIMRDSLKNLIKFWSLGVTKITALATLLPLTGEEIRTLITSAKEKKLISGEGRLTEKAYEMFSPKERELLKSLEVIKNGSTQ